MVLESIIDAETAEKKPYDSLILGFVMATVCIMLAVVVFTPFPSANFLLGLYAIAFLIFATLLAEFEFSLKWDISITILFLSASAIFLTYFNEYALNLNYMPYGTQVSLALVFFTSLGLAPLVMKLLDVEEKLDIDDLEDNFIERHYEVIITYGAIFLGMLLAFSLWFTVLPEQVIKAVFSEQLSTIRSISELRSSMFVSLGLATVTTAGFKLILVNNVKVLLVTILLSFALGSGAIFILAWNASIIGVAIGDLARQLISGYASWGAYAGVAAYFNALPMSFGQLFLHGFPEMVAYFIGGLAGGILSVAATKHQGRAVWHVILDAFELFSVAVLLLIVAGIVESKVMGL